MTYPSINQQFESIGSNINIPHVVIGSPEPKKPVKQYKPIGEEEYNKEIWYKKVEFWMFTVAVIIVLIYAGFRLIDMLLK